MKKALISPEEKVYSYDGILLGDRVAEVAAAEFPVAPPLFWTDCADDVIADQWCWSEGIFTPIPAPPPPTPMPEPAPGEGPTIL